MLVRYKKMILIHKINFFNVKAWDSCIMYKRWQVYNIQAQDHRLLSIVHPKMVNIFYLAFVFAICNYCICIVPIHTCEMHNAQTRPERPICLHWHWGSSHVNFLVLVLVVFFFFFTLASIGSTSPKTPKYQTFLMNINVCRTDKLHNYNAAFRVYNYNKEILLDLK